MNGRFLLFTFFSVLLISGKAYSQIKENSALPDHRFRDRVFTGGTLGLQFGTYTYVDISPLVGYKITERLSAGIGATYIYFKDNLDHFSTNMYGGRIFSRFLLTENLFAHAEYEILNREIIDYYYNRKRINITSILLGGGYRQPIGSNSFINLMILWNLNESIYSPYVNPIIRGGIGIGL